MYKMFLKKTMEFCNKGMVWDDPLPPVMVKYHIFAFFWDPSLTNLRKYQDVWTFRFSPK